MSMIILISITGPAFAQEIPSVDTEDLAKILSRNSDTVYVVNFWATWCSPCVKEIGYFEELHRKDDPLLRVLLVNLDFPNQVQERVQPFLQEKNLTAPVVNMSDMDYNKWIPLVHEEWSGAIPATLIFNKNKREFLGKEVTREELFEAVREFSKLKQI